MKQFFIGVFMVAVLMAGCRTAPQFSDITGKEWKLTEVRIDNKNIGFSRDALLNEGFGEAFTLNFDAQFISGVGAPNRYSAPYTLEEKQGISVKLARATLMAPIREPEKLREHDFFSYIQNASSWNLKGNNLELRSKTESGSEVVLVFSL
jgi:heat shock protein HslJ